MFICEDVRQTAGSRRWHWNVPQQTFTLCPWSVSLAGIVFFTFQLGRFSKSLITDSKAIHARRDRLTQSRALIPKLSREIDVCSIPALQKWNLKFVSYNHCFKQFTSIELCRDAKAGDMISAMKRHHGNHGNYCAPRWHSDRAFWLNTVYTHSAWVWRRDLLFSLCVCDCFCVSIVWHVQILSCCAY